MNQNHRTHIKRNVSGGRDRGKGEEKVGETLSGIYLTIGEVVALHVHVRWGNLFDLAKEELSPHCD